MFCCSINHASLFDSFSSRSFFLLEWSCLFLALFGAFLFFFVFVSVFFNARVTSIASLPLDALSRHVPFDPNRGATDTKDCHGGITPGEVVKQSRITSTCGNKVVLGMQMYVGWHSFLQQLANATGSFRYTIEDMSGANGNAARIKVVQEIFNRVGKHPPTAKQIDAVGVSMKKATNTRPHRGSLSWDELFRADKVLAMQAWQLGKDFGYSYPRFNPATWKPSPGQPAPTCKRLGR